MQRLQASEFCSLQEVCRAAPSLRVARSTTGFRLLRSATPPTQCATIALCSQGHNQGTADQEVLFDRKEEMAFLKRLANQKGRKLVLLSGPRNCGKSMILRNLASEERGVVLVNLRIGDSSTPEGFLEEFQSAVLAADYSGEFLEFLKRIARVASDSVDNLALRGKVGFDHPSGVKASISVEKPQKDKRLDQHVAFQKVFTRYLEQHQGSKITLVIDEANRLEAWLSNDVSARILRSYMDFFVYITKEMALSNVILVSSDFFLKFWLNEIIGSDRYVSQVIGDFAATEARDFFECELGHTCPDDMWECVYSVVGGAPFFLKSIAESVREDDLSWKDMLLDAFIEMQEQTALGLSPSSLISRAIPPSWTKEQYLGILTMMVQWRNGVMPWRLLRRAYDRNVLKGLICYNMIQYRTKNRLDKDVSWYEDIWPIAMPLSRLHFLAMKDLVITEQELASSAMKDGKCGWNDLMRLAADQ